MKKRQGQSLVEYGLVIGLMSVVAISGMNILGNKIVDAATISGNQVEVAAQYVNDQAEEVTAGWNDDNNDGSQSTVENDDKDNEAGSLW